MSSAPATLVLRAPAKLTLSLRITGVRPDGYHLLDAEMVSLDLADLIEVVDPVASPDPTVEVVGPSGFPLMVGPPEDNLAHRAMVLAHRPAHLRVTKQIPPGAGLGGGSSDAAAVLRWAEVDDLELAARLGADVPFCVVGGRARVHGIGELVEPRPFEEYELTLLTPPFGCSTVEVYRRWDELGGPIDERPDGNDLTAAALSVEPRLLEWRDRLGDATGLEPRLAGSGSTWFVEGAFPGQDLDHRKVVQTIPAGAELPVPGWFTRSRR